MAVLAIDSQFLLECTKVAQLLPQKETFPRGPFSPGGRSLGSRSRRIEGALLSLHMNEGALITSDYIWDQLSHTIQ